MRLSCLERLSETRYTRVSKFPDTRKLVIVEGEKEFFSEARIRTLYPPSVIYDGMQGGSNSYV